MSEPIHVPYGERIYIHAADGGRLLAVIEPGAHGVMLRTRTAVTRVPTEDDALKFIALGGGQ